MENCLEKLHLLLRNFRWSRLKCLCTIISALCLIWYLQSGSLLPVVIMTLMAFFIGFHLIMGIGGADMPVVVSMLIVTRVGQLQLMGSVWAMTF